MSPSLDARRRANLGYLNLDAAQAHGARPAIVDYATTPPRIVSHGELFAAMERVGAAAQGAGLKPGDIVLLAMTNRAEFIAAFFGLMRAGAVPIPLNVKLGADTIRFVLEDSRAVAAVVEPAANPHVVALAADATGLKTKIALAPAPPAGWQSYARWLDSADPAALDPPAIAGAEIAFIPYTSGSTGRPKGVMLAHRGLLWSIRTAQKYRPSGPDDRALVAGPLYHKNAMREGVKPRLHAGGSIVLMPKFDPRAALVALAEHECVHFAGVPAMFKLMLQQRDLLARLEFPKLKGLAMGSAVVGAELLHAVEAAFGVAARDTYGLTEGGGPLGSPRDGRPTPPESCGVQAPEVELKLVDADGRTSANQGELWVKSPVVAVGYLNLPGLTAERLPDGWLRTGDVFRRDAQGFYYFLGRTDDAFRSGGENIYPKEVENLLLGHAGVADVAVMPAPHPVKGHVPIALVVRRTGTDAGEDELKQYCLANGPAYAHPRRVFFVDAIPLGGTEKVDPKAVRELGLQLLAASPIPAASA
jgi:acyl-CoA synthetase (AMP-forming)/AMP-acid ligase II